MSLKVERALRLVQDYAISITSIAQDRAGTKSKKGFTLKAEVNPRTRKKSSRGLAFSESAWGSSTRGYSKNAKNNIQDARKLARIVTAAKVFERVTRRAG